MKITLDFKNPILPADEDLILQAWSLMQQHCPAHIANSGMLTIHYDSDKRQEGVEVFYGTSSSKKHRIFRKGNSTRRQESVKLTQVIKHRGNIF